MKGKIKIDLVRSKKEFRLKMSHPNGNIEFVASESYKRKQALVKSLQNFIEAIAAKKYEVWDLTGDTPVCLALLKQT